MDVTEELERLEKTENKSLAVIHWLRDQGADVADGYELENTGVAGDNDEAEEVKIEELEAIRSENEEYLRMDKEWEAFKAGV